MTSANKLVWAIATAVAFGVVLGVSVAVEQRSLGRERRAACDDAGGAALDRAGVRVLVRSELAADGVLRPGRIALCDEDPAATEAFMAVRAAVARSRFAAIDPVVVHFDPRRAHGVRPDFSTITHAETGGLLLARGDSMSVAVLMHELVHVAIANRRGRARATVACSGAACAGRRLLSAIEEGVADYGASAVMGSAILGDVAHGPVRDLRAPPKLGIEGWARLAAETTGFDPHPLGWSLAARLRQRFGDDLLVRDDLVTCVAGADDVHVAAVAAALVRACPDRMRGALRVVFEDWIPAELRAE